MALASSVRSDSALAFGDRTQGHGVDPATIGHVYAYRWEKGSDLALPALGTTERSSSTEFADDHNLRVGSRFTLTTPRARK